ncbi:50S ribosomal protein L18e [Candidatus Woesearchaeota archaeon]|nr:50S ribosomal protein L18e [Candidatus Woesearchaeota archaeon]
MAKRTGPTSLVLKKLIADLKSLSTKEKVKLWRRLAEDLSKSTRQRRKVNLYKIEKYTRDGEIAVVPGKVLSEGEINKKLTVAAFKFSDKAREKINKTGKAISIQQLMKENPKGKKVRILG